MLDLRSDVHRFTIELVKCKHYGDYDLHLGDFSSIVTDSQVTLWRKAEWVFFSWKVYVHIDFSAVKSHLSGHKKYNFVMGYIKFKLYSLIPQLRLK